MLRTGEFQWAVTDLHNIFHAYPLLRVLVLSYRLGNFVPRPCLHDVLQLVPPQLTSLHLPAIRLFWEERTAVPSSLPLRLEELSSDDLFGYSNAPPTLNHDVATFLAETAIHRPCMRLSVTPDHKWTRIYRMLAKIKSQPEARVGNDTYGY